MESNKSDKNLRGNMNKTKISKRQKKSVKNPKTILKRRSKK